MGKRVLASSAVCAAFGSDLPAGLQRCDRPTEYIEQFSGPRAAEPAWDPAVREAALHRFSWAESLQAVSAEFERLEMETDPSHQPVLS